MRLIFPEEEGEQLYIVENVYPKIDALNVEPLPEGHSGCV